MTRNPQTPPTKIVLVEGTDYYLENGYWVFTEKYHLDRGHCCGSGCRHCPYPNAECGVRSAELKSDDDSSVRGA